MNADKVTSANSFDKLDPEKITMEGVIIRARPTSRKKLEGKFVLLTQKKLNIMNNKER
jgi:hypothetical protein